MYFQIRIVVWRSPISALQVAMVENVKLRHEFAPFLAYILYDLLHCAIHVKCLEQAYILHGLVRF